MSDERVIRVPYDSISDYDRAMQQAINDGLEMRGDREIRLADLARRLTAALEREREPLEDVFASVPWLASLEVRWTEDEVYEAEISGYIHEDGYRGGSGTGTTVAEAIRAAVAAAKEVG